MGKGKGGESATADDAAVVTPDERKERKQAKKRKRQEAAAAATDATAEASTDGASAAADDKAARKAAKKLRKAQAAAAAAAASENGASAEAEEPAKKKKGKAKKEQNGNGAAAAPTPKAAAAAAASEEVPVTVDGMDLTPVKDFAAAGFPEVLATFLAGQGFKSPTPIQSYCWPALSGARDVVGIAETGSGKTLAFALPGLARLLNNGNGKPSGRKPGGGGGGSSGATPRMLVLAPTRELALQSAEVVAAAGKACGVACACVYGGVPKADQRRALRGGGGAAAAAIVVATPGRLKDLAQEGVLSLSAVEYLVLDEADRMLDLGFEKDVRDIVEQTAQGRQTAMFSATWPPEVRELAGEFLSSPVRVNIGGSDTLTANVRVSQAVEVVEERSRDGRLVELLRSIQAPSAAVGGGGDRILVFALYKKEAARLERLLSGRGWQAVAVHGDKAQNERERALAKFRSGECPLMVATDVAARGLDIPGVEHVINYSFPLTIEDYVHRIGRTGRAGKMGSSHTFFHMGDKARAGELVQVLTEAGQPVPEALTKFGTHVKKKEHKLYGAFGPDASSEPLKKATKITFDSDGE